MCVSICTHVSLMGRILECVEYWKGIEALPEWYNLALKPVIGLKALDCPAEVLTEKKGRERCQKRFSLKPRWKKRKCYRLSKKLLLMSPYPEDSQNLNYWNIILIDRSASHPETRVTPQSPTWDYVSPLRKPPNGLPPHLRMKSQHLTWTRPWPLFLHPQRSSSCCNSSNPPSLRTSLSWCPVSC